MHGIKDALLFYAEHLQIHSSTIACSFKNTLRKQSCGDCLFTKHHLWFPGFG